MKTGYRFLCIVVLMFMGCSSLRTIDSGTRPVLITDLDKMADEYVARLKNEGLLVKFDKGDIIPVEVTAQLPFAQLESGENRLVFAETTYVYLSKDGAFVSKDGKLFAPVYDAKALNKIYGTGRGTLSIGFSISKEKGARLQTDVSLK